NLSVEQDITLGISLGSSTQISLFLVPLTIVVAWIKDIHMDLNFKLLETGTLVSAILITTFTLQVILWSSSGGCNLGSVIR
ncbi:hypothetical protein BHE74_00023380, partial [Ensete ventricosum]